MATNDVLLQIALNNLDVIGNVIGGELGNAIAGKSDSDKSLAEFKDSMKDPVGNLEDIPDEVYAGIMEAYYDAIKSGQDAEQVLDELTNDDKNLTSRIKSALKKLVTPVESKEVQITHSDGDVDTYKISFPLSGVGVDNVATVAKGKEISVLSWEAETDGKVAMFKYFLSLWKLEKKLTDTLLYECYKLFKSGAADLLKATYSNLSSEDLIKILGTDDKKEIQSTIENALPENSYLTNALDNYGDLATLYNNLQEEINSPKATYTSINKAAAKFLKASDSIVSYLGGEGVSLDITALPNVLDPIDPYLIYNTAMTVVSVLAGHGDKVDTSTKYNKKVKTIDASLLVDIVEIIGNAKANKITGGANDDTISGGKGNDSILGGAGNDSLFGDAGNDKLYGEDGDDILIGGRGKDLLWGGAGNDTIYGEADNDKLYGEDGDDILLGGKGKDSLWGGEGNDSLAGEAGNDKISGDAGDDSIFGGAGNDSLWGGEGNDSIYGEAGNDKIFSGAGDDILIGGAGNDSLWGNEGANIFYYADGDGNDIIFEHSPNEDKIFLTSGAIDDVMLNGNDVIFKIGNGSIKVDHAKGTEITVQFADGAENKYLNGELISPNPE